jgi:hypothetical protein
MQWWELNEGRGGVMPQAEPMTRTQVLVVAAAQAVAVVVVIAMLVMGG